VGDTAGPVHPGRDLWFGADRPVHRDVCLDRPQEASDLFGLHVVEHAAREIIQLLLLEAISPRQRSSGRFPSCHAVRTFQPAGMGEIEMHNSPDGWPFSTISRM
jgi:hypothetical protein